MGLDRKKAPLPDNTDGPDLINEGFADSMSFYCENVTYTDEMIWGFLNLYLYWDAKSGGEFG